MPPPVIAVTVVGERMLQVGFADGLERVVQMHPSHLRGVFAVLRSPSVFAQVGIDHGAVSWPGELGLAPDAMYAAIRADGRWELQ